MTAEERTRTLTGRHQISNDGRRLVDGIPFGRPYLRNPSRPAVRIPPRKRQRMDDAYAETEPAALLPDVAEASASTEVALLTNGDSGAGFDRAAKGRRASKRVRFDRTQLDDDEDEDSNDDDEDFAPEGEEGGDALMDEDTAEDDSDSASDSDSDSSGASDTSSSDSDSDDSSSDSDSNSDASAPPEVRSSKGVLEPVKRGLPNSPKHVVPGEGRAATRSRNSRRTRTNRLRHLKAAGKLPPDADLKALEEYEAGLPAEITQEPEASEPLGPHAGKRKRADDDGVAEDATQDMTELEQRKKELMARFGEEESNTVEQVEALPQEPMLAQDTNDASPTAEKVTPKKRLRPDTSAISRILARQAMVCAPIS